MPPDCKPYQTDAGKQMRFELFVRDERAARAAAAGMMHAREIDGEIAEFAKVAAFFSQKTNKVISDRFTSAEVRLPWPSMTFHDLP